MTAAHPDLRLLCFVSAAERDVMISATRQLAESVGKGLGRPWSLRLAFGDPQAAAEPAAILVISLLGEMTSSRSIAEIEAVWVRQVSLFGGTPVVIPTIYRWIEDGHRRMELAERCRQLNLLAIRLSRGHGVEVADVDRAFALLGTAAVGSDYRCQGETAAALAGHVLAETLLGCDLAPHLSVETQLQALAAHGKLTDLFASREERTA